MDPHQIAGGVGVASCDRVGDGDVLLGDVATDVGRHGGLAHRALDRLADGRHPHVHDAVVGCRRDRHVESQVGLQETVGIVDQGQAALGELADALDLGRAGTAGGQAAATDLLDLAGFGELGQADALVAEEELEVVGESPADLVRVAGVHERTTSCTRRDADVAAPAEQPQRLANRRPTDGEAIGELALVGHAGAGLELAGHDRRLDLAGDRLVRDDTLGAHGPAA